MVKARAGRQDIRAVVGTDIEIQANAIVRAAADFVSEGFKVGDKVYVKGAANSGNNKSAIVTAVAAGMLSFADATFPVSEAAGTKISIIACDGGSLRNLLNGGTLRIYNGIRPATASDDKAGCTALMAIQGVTFGDPVYNADGYAEISAQALPITGNPSANGLASWARFTKHGDEPESQSTDAVRFDGTVGVGSGDVRVSTTTFTVGTPQVVSSFTIKVPIG